MFIYNLQEKAKSLQSEYDNLSSRIEHSGLKGTIREDVLKKYLKELLPKKYEVTSGCIVDCSEKQSKQQDFIIFDNFNSPSFVESEKEQIVPIESVYATVEIKSNLTIEELKKAIINIDSVHELEKTKSTVPQLFSSPTRAPLSMIFSYTSDTSLENIAKNLDELNENIEYKNRVSIICILDKGLIFGVDKNGFTNILLSPNENTIYTTHEDKIENNLYLYYLLMISGLNSIWLPPVNLMAYAEKIHKADFSHTLSNNRKVPDDAYFDVGNGMRINIKKARDIAKTIPPKIQKFSEGNMSKEELREYIIDVLLKLPLNEIIMNKKNKLPEYIEFFDEKIALKELKKIENNEDDSEKILDKIYNIYKKKLNNNK